jgi:hypothetical protein
MPANPFDTYRQLHEDKSSGFGVDSVTLDVPLLMRIMEVCREEIEDDEELHRFATQIVAVKDRGVLSMRDWDDICTCSRKSEMSEQAGISAANKHLSAAKFHHDMAHFHSQKNHEAGGHEHHLDSMIHHGDLARSHAKQAKAHGASKSEIINHAGHYADSV